MSDTAAAPARTGYINRLQDENAALKAKIAEVDSLLIAFRAHLASPKFHDDTTIQVRDVDARLVEIWRATA